MAIRYVPVKYQGRGFTIMRQDMLKSPLSSLGDAMLVWVNEADFRAANPVDVEEDARDRARYEELRAKFGFEK